VERMTIVLSGWCPRAPPHIDHTYSYLLEAGDFDRKFVLMDNEGDDLHQEGLHRNLRVSCALQVTCRKGSSGASDRSPGLLVKRTSRQPSRHLQLEIFPTSWIQSSRFSMVLPGQLGGPRNPSSVGGCPNSDKFRFKAPVLSSNAPIRFTRGCQRPVTRWEVWAKRTHTDQWIGPRRNDWGEVPESKRQN
jgi:hypothetical protein